MPESTVEAEKEQNKRKCPRCGEAVGTSNIFWIDETLKNVVVCGECAKPLQAAHEKLAGARDAFVRMVYDHLDYREKAPVVVGHVIMTVRCSTKEELAKFGWEDGWPTDVLVLSNGTVIIPAADGELNNSGALYGIGPKGNALEFE